MTSDDKVTYFGVTDSRNKQIKFGIKAKDRTRHFYVIGKTGMGKSTLLENMAVQDIQGGEGMCFIDPHGKSADLLLEYIPESRIKDVVYFAPFDTDHPIAFNVMEDVGYDKRHLVVSGLMSTFKKIWVDAWSARMEYILSNTLLALLEYPGATLLGVNKMYSDKAYRKKVVDNVKDPSVRSFWVDEFAKYTDKFAAEATPAIQNKIGQFTNNPLIRNIIGQPKSSFDIRKMMDERKIMIVNLSKGRVGESNANLLGAMLITKIYLAAMSRADVSETVLRSLPQFYLYVDEFQSFANESFADILSEARKYKLNLTIAHQYIEQMSDEVRAAVFGNVGTMVVFRVGAYDADVLEKEFAPQFTAEDIVNLGQFQMYLRLMIDGVGSQPFSARGMLPIAPPAVSFKDQAVESSRAQFGQIRSMVEEHVRIQTMGEEQRASEAKMAAASAAGPAGSTGPTPASSAAGPAPVRPAGPAQAPRDVSPRRDDRPRDDRPREGRFERSDRPGDRLMRRDDRPQQSDRRPDAPRNASGNGTGALPPRPVERPAPPHDPDGGFQSFDALKGLVQPRPSPAAAGNGRPAPRQNDPSLPRKDDKKGVTEESRADLRQALASLAKTGGDQKPKPAEAAPQKAAAPAASAARVVPPPAKSSAPVPAPVSAPTPATAPASQAPAKPAAAEAPSPKASAPLPPKNESQNGPKEVPEDVLKKILDM